MIPFHLIILIALLALIWGYTILRHTGLIGGCLATILAGSVFGYDFLHINLLTTDRLILSVVAITYFIQRNVFGLAPRKFTKTDVVLILFLICLTGSTFAHQWRFDGAQPAATLLFFYLMPFAVYWIASRCPITESSHRWVIGFFAVFGAYLSLTAVCEVLGLSALVFPKYIVNPSAVEFLGRGRGPFVNPIGNGMYLTAGLIATLLWWPHVKKLHQPAVIGLAGLNCLGAVCTLTRSVWLGVAVALVGMATLVVPKQHRLRVILLAAIAGGLAVGVGGSNLMSFKRDKHLTAKETEDSAKLRPILAAIAYEMFQDRPLTGVGLGQYSRHNFEYLTQRSFDVPVEKGKTYIQHNVFLSQLVENGLIGLVFFVVALCLWVLDGWSLWHAVELPLWQRQFGLFTVLMVAAYFPNAMFHEMSVITMLNMLMFFIAGLCRNMQDQMVVAFDGTPIRSTRLQLTHR